MKMRVTHNAACARWRLPLAATTFAAMLAGLPAPAGATRYLGTRSVGTGTVDLSIDTDGKIGALAAADIVAWTVLLKDASSAFPLRTLTNDGTGGSVRSFVEMPVVGAVSATSTALSFTYGLGSIAFYSTNTVRPYYRIVSSMCATGAFGDAGPCEQFDTGSDYYSQHPQYSLHRDMGPGTNTVVIGTAAAVPEPGAWSLMIVGFGLVGSLARARSVTDSRRVV